MGLILKNFRFLNLKSYNKIQIELIKSSRLDSKEWIFLYARKFNLIINGCENISELKEKLYKK